MFKRIITKLILAIPLVTLLTRLTWGIEPAQNIILFIGDGMGPSH